MTRFTFFSCVLLCLATPNLNAGVAPRIAIIIDDLGYNLAAGERAVELPGPVVCAVLPHTPNTSRLAAAAHAKGKEVLLHLPLQAIDNDAPGESGNLHLDMSRSQFVSAFSANLTSVPHVSGVNNHQGSMLTRHPGHMSWLMDEIAARYPLFFVDSYTTSASVALNMAQEAGVPALRRDVFLDNDPTTEAIEREFEKLKMVARDKGFAIGIGHPYPATLDVLERQLPMLHDEGFELISLGTHLEQQAKLAIAGM